MKFQYLNFAASLAFSHICRAFHEEIRHVPEPWTFVGLPDPDDILQLNIALTHPRFDALAQYTLHVSTPGHELYGQHLSERELHERFLAPENGSLPQVLHWLAGHGIQGTYDGHFVQFSTNVHKADSLLNASFSRYNSPTHGSIVRTTGYDIPEHMQSLVDFVFPTIKFPSLSPSVSAISEVHSAAEATKSSCNTTLINPSCLRKFYNFPEPTSDKALSRLAFASFLGQQHVPEDLTTFLNEYAPYANSSSVQTKKFPNPGAKPNGEGHLEANLDAAYALSLAYPIPVMEFTTPGCGPYIPEPNEPVGSCSNEPYLAFLSNLLKLSDAELPDVISISYSEDEQSWPEKAARRACDMFAALGARGVSVLVASGDHGTGTICAASNGKKRFLPTFPSSCPFVTSVGSTKNLRPEIAVDYTGSGFSNFFARPAYQDSAVTGYLKHVDASGDKFKQFYNRSGRAFPDISAQGVNFAVVDGNSTLSLSGTSASTPVIAAAIALMNDKRAKSGKAKIGFVNPLLYSGHLSQGLRDVTKGRTSGCRVVKPIKGAGWDATVGWDAATGVGTADVGKLLEIV